MLPNLYAKKPLSTLSLLKVVKFIKKLQKKQFYAKVLPKRFNLNGQTTGFYPQTQKLELHTK